MDINGINGVEGLNGACMRTGAMPLGVTPLGAIPLGVTPFGLGMNLMVNEGAMQGYSKLTETEKEHLIMRCRDARSKDEMQKIVDDLAPGTDVRAIMQEERDGRIV